MRKILAFFLILIFCMFALPAGMTALSKYKDTENPKIEGRDNASIVNLYKKL